MDPVRIDLGMRFVVTVDSYRRAGLFMDDLAEAVQGLLANDEVGGHFDFTHFQTRPCKANKMAQLAAMPDDFAIPETDGGGVPGGF